MQIFHIKRKKSNHSEKSKENSAQFINPCPLDSEGINPYPYQKSGRGESDGIGYKNQEGYPDVVPYQAFANIDREQKRFRPMVYICSPFSGDIAGNIKKAKQYSRYAVNHGAIPIAPHLLFPQFMSEETERDRAVFMGIAILSKCAELWVFGDVHSKGMENEIAYAERKNMTIRYFTDKEISLWKKEEMEK